MILPNFYEAQWDDATSIQHPFGFENPFVIARAMVRFSPSRGTSAIPEGFIAGGAAGFGDDCRVRAFSEMVERASAIIGGHELHARLHKWPQNLSQYNGHRPGYVWPHESDASVWIPATRYSSSGIARHDRAPASLAYLQWRPFMGETIGIRPAATGLATHVTAQAAIRNAVFEVVERDICIKAWRLADWPANEVTDQGKGTRLFDCAELAGISIRLFQVFEPSGLKVVIAVATDRIQNRASVGSSCRDNLAAAINASTAEALALQDTLKKSEISEDVDEPSTSMEHLMWASKRGSEITQFLLDKQRFDVPQIKDSIATDEIVVKCAKSYDCDVFVCRVDCRAAEKAGWKTVRVLVPNAVSPELERSMPLGDFLTARLSANFRPTINRLPHPFC